MREGLAERGGGRKNISGKGVGGEIRVMCQRREGEGEGGKSGW